MINFKFNAIFWPSSIFDHVLLYYFEHLAFLNYVWTFYQHEHQYDVGDLCFLNSKVSLESFKILVFQF